jgi:uncharacterized protein (DUF58 family)
VNIADTEAGVYVTLQHLARLRHKARGFSFLPRQPVTSLLAGGHASKIRGRGLDFEEIRKYLPGDDPRTIDWKVTARTRKPHSRVFTEERERPVLLVVDQRLGMFFGSVQMTKSVVAAKASALGAWRTVAVKDRVGGVVFNDTDAVEVRPQRTQSTVMHLLRTITDQNRALRADSPVKPNPAMLNKAIRCASRVATHDFLVILITDGDGSNAETRELLTTIARHNDVLVSFVFDPLEALLPAAGSLVVSDGDRQMEMDTGGESLRIGFAREFAEHRATAKRYLLTREVPVVPLRTDMDVADQILRALGARPGGRRA